LRVREDDIPPHPRPPIPIVALDEPAAAAVRRRLAGRGAGRLADLAVWLAAVSGADPPALRERFVAAGDGAGAHGELTVPEVAAAVDAGRHAAAGAAREGVTVLATATRGAGSDDAADRLVTLLDAHGPLGALRRGGTREIAVVCGLALGAGEHGLGLICDGPGATAAAAVAVGVEPGLRPRLLVADRSPQPAHAALLQRLALEPVLELGTRGDGTGATAALALLRVAAALAA
jgi:nicotinate-nucleotide--dimethylbenzimidazole phosphoribosyltransferase